MRVKSRESLLFNNRKSLLQRGLPSVSPGVPYGPSPLILRKALVHCFSQPSRSLQRDSLWWHVLLAAPFCLAILAESRGQMLLRIGWAAMQGGPHTFHCVMGSSGSLFSPLSSSVYSLTLFFLTSFSFLFWEVTIWECGNREKALSAKFYSISLRFFWVTPIKEPGIHVWHVGSSQSKLKSTSWGKNKSAL